jgi:hypothetical protein
LTNWVLIAIAITFMLLFSLTHSYAWHENLGIDNNKAAELYKTSPNEPAIIQWKNALQSAINDMGNCYNIESAISCESLFSTIISNCNSHPNELLACNDARLAQYPLILKNAQEAEERPINVIIDRCINTNSDTSCDGQMRALQHYCVATPSSYKYCNDNRFLGYLRQHNILNTTGLP